MNTTTNKEAILTAAHPVIELGKGLIEVGEGYQGDLPALIFGPNGTGVIGAATESSRTMQPGECLAAITFGNAESLDVVALKLAQLRAKHWPTVAATPSVQGESIDTPEFRELVQNVRHGLMAQTWSPLIAHIEAWHRARLARTAAPSEQERRYATQIATALWEAHYKADAPQWRVLNDLYGALSQIDNMTYGLTRKVAPAAPSEGLAIPADAELVARFKQNWQENIVPMLDEARKAGLGKSLLRPAINAASQLPPGCFCPPDKCGAPVIMGRQTPCRREFITPATEQAKPELAQSDLMPKRAAFIAWCATRGIDTAEDNDAWGARKFHHPHVESMWHGWFHATAILAAQPVPQASGERDAWVSVKDRLPSEDELVLICGPMPRDEMNKYSHWRTCAHFFNGSFLNANGCTQDSATHWQPLPDAPSSAATTSKPDAPFPGMNQSTGMRCTICFAKDGEAHVPGCAEAPVPTSILEDAMMTIDAERARRWADRGPDRRQQQTPMAPNLRQGTDRRKD